MIDLDTSKLRECGKDIVKLSEDLNEMINLFYDRIINIPIKTGEWYGNSADEFAEKAKLDKQEAIEFKKCLCNYGTILIDNANKYDGIIKDNVF